MDDSDLTCWTVIKGAAAGEPQDRAEFVRRYAPVIRAYLLARWKGAGPAHELDDAMQEVFLDCFRDEGALTRAEPRREGRVPGVLAGTDRPATWQEMRGFAEVFCNLGYYGHSARFYRQAFAEWPALLDDFEIVYSAAYCAELRVAGKGKEAGAPDSTERLEWSRQARAWLRLSGPLLSAALWDPDFAGVREEAGLETLPAAERKAWVVLWEEARAAR